MAFSISSSHSLRAILQSIMPTPVFSLNSLINEADARKLPKCTFVDFRDKEKFDQGHVNEANHVDYANMFTKPMMEELNKSNNLVIIHDVPEVAGVIAATLKLMDYPDVYILK